jgi:hypothetical protein
MVIFRIETKSDHDKLVKYNSNNDITEGSPWTVDKTRLSSFEEM